MKGEKTFLIVCCAIILLISCALVYLTRSMVVLYPLLLIPMIFIWLVKRTKYIEPINKDKTSAPYDGPEQYPD